jgi:hypothetical protein
VQCHVLNDAVALVEDPEHGHALRHRSHSGLLHIAGRRRAGLADRRSRRFLLLGAPSTGGKRKRRPD